MKYHWQIIDERYPEESVATSKTFLSMDPITGITDNFEGYDTPREAEKDAEKEKERNGWNESYYTIEIDSK